MANDSDFDIEDLRKPVTDEDYEERVFEDDPDREPNHPGETLEGYIDKYDLMKGEVADTLNVSQDTISKICNGHRTKISTDMAIRLSKLFDTTAQFWLNLSHRRKLWEQHQKSNSEYEQIEERVKDLDISGKGHGESA